MTLTPLQRRYLKVVFWLLILDVILACLVRWLPGEHVKIALCCLILLVSISTLWGASQTKGRK